ncbi:uncharacterized protein MONBRDRAFT_39041 [Monosiga brevicollis MX1]|uniref:Non-specific protein-tyrosine kinase n=1 Tax=Monosiga brevicollis TaxID=81824 RepID=A9VBU9_MONBE|nr:uncharacterized protein MONBRDRAFT_39041 [Monosiga brevicollis MX1]EDQ85039.1 predicted protein [Monosiga brevicollis MX1]|eukprot:XP_001750209.1 hypothetical protein [Monosiga brevicollis MX1]
MAEDVAALVRQGCLDQLILLAQQNPQLLITPDSQGLTPFLTACACGQVAVAQWLRANNFTDLSDREPKTGAHGLHLAAVRHQTAIVAWLLEQQPACVDVRTKDNATALRIVCEAGFDDLVRLLLQAGADPLITDDTQLSAITAAVRYRRAGALQLLQLHSVSNFPQAQPQAQPPIGHDEAQDRMGARRDSYAIILEGLKLESFLEENAGKVNPFGIDQGEAGAGGAIAPGQTGTTAASAVAPTSSAAGSMTHHPGAAGLGLDFGLNGGNPGLPFNPALFGDGSHVMLPSRQAMGFSTQQMPAQSLASQMQAAPSQPAQTMPQRPPIAVEDTDAGSSAQGPGGPGLNNIYLSQLNSARDYLSDGDSSVASVDLLDWSDETNSMLSSPSMSPAAASPRQASGSRLDQQHDSSSYLEVPASGRRRISNQGSTGASASGDGGPGRPMRQYHCKFCDKAFSCSSNLKRHVRIHTAECGSLLASGIASASLTPDVGSIVIDGVDAWNGTSVTIDLPFPATLASITAQNGPDGEYEALSIELFSGASSVLSLTGILLHNGSNTKTVVAPVDFQDQAAVDRIVVQPQAGTVNASLRLDVAVICIADRYPADYSLNASGPNTFALSNSPNVAASLEASGSLGVQTLQLIASSAAAVQVTTPVLNHAFDFTRSRAYAVMLSTAAVSVGAQVDLEGTSPALTPASASLADTSAVQVLEFQFNAVVDTADFWLTLDLTFSVASQVELVAVLLLDDPLNCSIEYGTFDDAGTCRFCDGTTDFSDTLGANTCQTVTTCDGGNTYETMAPTISSDRVCAQFCASGATDHDDNATTPCETCAPGSYINPASPASGPCSDFICAAGTVDDDANVSTPCVACAAGHYVPANATGNCSLYICAAGEVDDDSDPSTPCIACAAGTYAPTGSVGPCTDFTCARGSKDLDGDPTTECEECAAGTFDASATGSPEPLTECAACAVGTFSDAPGATSCNTCDSCGTGEYVARGCILTENVICASCSSCAEGDPVVTACTAYADTLCQSTLDAATNKSTNGDKMPLGIVLGVVAAIFVTLFVVHFVHYRHRHGSETGVLPSVSRQGSRGHVYLASSDVPPAGPTRPGSANPNFMRPDPEVNRAPSSRRLSIVPLDEVRVRLQAGSKLGFSSRRAGSVKRAASSLLRLVCAQKCASVRRAYGFLGVRVIAWLDPSCAATTRQEGGWRAERETMLIALGRLVVADFRVLGASMRMPSCSQPAFPRRVSPDHKGVLGVLLLLCLAMVMAQQPQLFIKNECPDSCSPDASVTLGYNGFTGSHIARPRADQWATWAINVSTDRLELCCIDFQSWTPALMGSYTNTDYLVLDMLEQPSADLMSWIQTQRPKNLGIQWRDQRPATLDWAQLPWQKLRNLALGFFYKVSFGEDTFIPIGQDGLLQHCGLLATQPDNALNLSAMARDVYETQSYIQTNKLNRDGADKMDTWADGVGSSLGLLGATQAEKLRFLSPEALDDNHFSSSSDVFAFGVLLWEVLLAETMFKGESRPRIAQRIRTHNMPALPVKYSTFADVYSHLVDRVPARRPSFDNLYFMLLNAETPESGYLPQLAVATIRPTWSTTDLIAGTATIDDARLAGSPVTCFIPRKANSDAHWTTQFHLLLQLPHDGLVQVLSVTECTLEGARRPCLVVPPCAPYASADPPLPAAQVVKELALDVLIVLEYLAARQCAPRDIRLEHCVVLEGRIGLVGLALANVGASLGLLENYLSFLREARGGLVALNGNATLDRVIACVEAFMTRVDRYILPEATTGDGLTRPQLQSEALSALARELRDICQPNSSWNVPLSALQFVRVLGSGQFGEVWLASMPAHAHSSPNYSSKETAAATSKREVMLVAVKRLLNDECLHEFEQELAIMMKIRHANLVRMLFVVQEKQHRALVLEYLDGGALDSWLQGQSKPPSEERTRHILHSIACGMLELQRLGMVHRDLAARNVLCDAQMQVVKVADYGLSRSTRVGKDDEQAYYKFKTRRPMPVRWMAPEVLKTQKFTVATDVFSFGVLVGEVLTQAELPLAHLNDESLMLRITDCVKSGGYGGRPLHAPPVKAPAWVSQIMVDCTLFDAAARPDFADLVVRLSPFTFMASPTNAGRARTNTGASSMSSRRMTGTISQSSGLGPGRHASVSSIASSLRSNSGGPVLGHSNEGHERHKLLSETHDSRPLPSDYYRANPVTELTMQSLRPPQQSTHAASQSETSPYLQPRGQSPSGANAYMRPQPLNLRGAPVSGMAQPSPLMMQQLASRPSPYPQAAPRSGSPPTSPGPSPLSPSSQSPPPWSGQQYNQRGPANAYVQPRRLSGTGAEAVAGSTRLGSFSTSGPQHNQSATLSTGANAYLMPAFQHAPEMQLDTDAVDESHL